MMEENINKYGDNIFSDTYGLMSGGNKKNGCSVQKAQEI